MNKSTIRHPPVQYAILRRELRLASIKANVGNKNTRTHVEDGVPDKRIKKPPKRLTAMLIDSMRRLLKRRPRASETMIIIAPKKNTFPLAN